MAVPPEMAGQFRLILSSSILMHLSSQFTTSRIALATLLSCTFASPTLALELCVTRLPSLPEHLTNNAVTSVQNSDGSHSIYSFTGIAGETVLGLGATLNSYRFDTNSGLWTSIADAPGVMVFQNDRPKIGASAVTVAGEVYLLGGYSVPGLEITERQLYRYDPSNNSYQQLSEVPTEVDDTVVGVYQDRFIYVVSGWHGPNNDNVRAVQIYDTVEDTWQNATDLPGPFRGLFGHAGTIIGDRIVALDGVQTGGGNFTISDNVYVGQIDADDRTDVVWQEASPHPGLPTYRAAASQSATSDGRMLLIGGTDNPYNFTGIGYNGVPANPLSQALLFDPVTGEWEEIDMVGAPLATMDHRGLVSVGDNMWATIGGMDAARSATDQAVLYHLVEDGHVCIVPEPMGALGIYLTVLMAAMFRRRR